MSLLSNIMTIIYSDKYKYKSESYFLMNTHIHVYMYILTPYECLVISLFSSSTSFTFFNSDSSNSFLQKSVPVNIYFYYKFVELPASYFSNCTVICEVNLLAQ